jgi:hypothetical protein
MRKTNAHEWPWQGASTRFAPEFAPTLWRRALPPGAAHRDPLHLKGRLADAHRHALVKISNRSLHRVVPLNSPGYLKYEYHHEHADF